MLPLEAGEGNTLDALVLNEGITTITWTVTDQSDNTSVPCSFDVTVNPLPNPVITGNDEVFGGETEVYQTGFVTDHSYDWSVSNNGTVVDPGVSSNIKEIIWDEVLVETTATVTVTETNDDTQCSEVYEFSVTIKPVALKGTITYHNTNNTPMNGVDVRLMNGTTVVDQTTTDASGNYKFNSVIDGIYTLEVETDKAWGGVNSTDALGIQRTAIAPTSPFTWWAPDAFIDNVGDVNESSSLSSLDATLIKQRTVYLINSFAAGEWAFWDAATEQNFDNSTSNIASVDYIHAGPATFNIQAMSYGDVNGSYQPPSFKALAAVPGDKVKKVVGTESFELPVYLMGDQPLGAFTIHLNFDESMIKVFDLKSEIDGLLYTIEDGWINVAWSDLESLNIPSGGVLFTLGVEAVQKVTEYDDLFKVNSETQFADPYCKTLDNVYLSIDKVEAKFKSGFEDLADMYAISCFPNPVKDVMNVTYSLPENGQVQITILNSLGDQITTLVDNPQSTGNYTETFEPKKYGLATGVYYCKMVVDGEQTDFTEVVRIVYMK